MPSPELAAHIRRQIELLPTEFPKNWPNRVFKEKLKALPVHYAADYLWGIRPDGTVLRMDLQPVGLSGEPEDDLLTIYAVVAYGARKYPELGELVPDRTTLGMPGSPVSIAEYVTASARMAGAQLCDDCGGTGSDEASDCSECSGLGWLLNRPAAE